MHAPPGIPHKKRPGETGARGMSSFSITIGETVVVERAVNDKSGMHAVVVSKHTKLWKNVAYFLEHEESESEDDAPAKRSAIPSITQVRDRLRGKDKPATEMKQLPADDQKELMQRKRDKMEAEKAKKSIDGKFNTDAKSAFKEIRACGTRLPAHRRRPRHPRAPARVHPPQLSARGFRRRAL